MKTAPAIPKALMKWLAKHYDKAFTQIWLLDTPQGNEYRRSNHKPKTNCTPQANIRQFLSQLAATGWHSTGEANFGGLTAYQFVKVDREIMVLVHNDKGDIYGVFDKINESNLPLLTNMLILDQPRHLQQTIADIRSKLIAMSNDLKEDVVTVAGIEHCKLGVLLISQDLDKLNDANNTDQYAICEYCEHIIMIHGPLGCVNPTCDCRRYRPGEEPNA